MSDRMLEEEPTGFPDDADLEELVGDWRMYQRRGGHRASTDDVVTAWFATHLSPSTPARYLDLGCGVGSVLLLTARALRPGFSLGIEAQEASALMCSRSVSLLPSPPPIEIVHADFRTIERAGHAPFDLVTGSPPYFPIGTGVLPSDPQRRACRFELRGGVEDYCATGASLLADEGQLVLVFPSLGASRVRDGASRAGLHVRARVELSMRQDRAAPFLDVWALTKTPRELMSRRFAIRDAEGRITPEYAAARTELGLRPS